MKRKLLAMDDLFDLSRRLPRTMCFAAAVGFASVGAWAQSASTTVAPLPPPIMARSDDAIIGFVKTVHPQASVTTDGVVAAAEPGTPLYAGSVIRTGPQGTLGLTLKDNTVLSMGGDTDVRMDDFLYEPGKDNLKLGASITKGSLQYVSGVIAKLKPEAVAIRTPTGTIGVRGTRFVVYVESPR